jgi:tetratricopeptide (TPR) repeat protein
MLRGSLTAVAVGLVCCGGCSKRSHGPLDQRAIQGLFNAERYADVVGVCNRRLKEEPGDLGALETRASAYLYAQEPEALLADCEAIEKAAPQSVSPHLLRGFVNGLEVRDIVAVYSSGIGKVEAAGGDATQLYYFRAETLFRLTRDDEAISDCRRALDGLRAHMGAAWTGPGEFAQRAVLQRWLAAFEADQQRKESLLRGAVADETLAAKLYKEKYDTDYVPETAVPRGPQLLEIRVQEPLPRRPRR